MQPTQRGKFHYPTRFGKYILSCGDLNFLNNSPPVQVQDVVIFVPKLIKFIKSTLNIWHLSQPVYLSSQYWQRLAIADACES